MDLAKRWDELREQSIMDRELSGMRASAVLVSETIRDCLSDQRLRDYVESLKQWRRNVVNPDNITEWADLGWPEPPEGFESIEDWIMSEGDLDERQQVTQQVLEGVIHDLESLISHEAF